VRSPERYIDVVERGAPPTAGAEITDAGQRRAERLLMGLRTTEGVARGVVAPIDDRVVRDLVTAGLLIADGNRLALTSAGMRLASAVTVRLL
jgi:coproporphyrinogen III oxidase-like Fe-S oxidoreductase